MTDRRMSVATTKRLETTAHFQRKEVKSLQINTKIVAKQLVLQELQLTQTTNQPEDDDGFLLKQLMVNLRWRVQEKEASSRMRDVLIKQGRRMAAFRTLSSLNSWSSHEDAVGSVALKLLKCIERVRETTAIRRTQGKLQDMILDWINRPPELIQPKEIDLGSFYASRRAFWQTYHADTRKWEGSNSVPQETVRPSSVMKTGNVGNRSSSLLDTSAASADHYAQTGISPHRKDLDVPTAAKKAKRNYANGSRTRLNFGSICQSPGADRLSATGSEFDFPKMNVADRRSSLRAALDNHVGESVQCSGSRPPQLLPDLPEFKDFNVNRRTRHRTVAAVDEGHRGHGKHCACGTCREKSKRIMDTTQGIVRRVFGKPITTLGEDSLEDLVEKSKTTPLPKCLSLPIIRDAQMPNVNNALAVRDALNPPYERLPVFPDAFRLDDTVSSVRSGTWRYLRECENLRCAPKAQHFLLNDLSQQSSRPLPLDLHSQGLRDSDLDAILSAAIKFRHRINEINLSDNGFSDESIALFMTNLPATEARLVDLSNSGCQHRAISSVAKQLENAWTRVKTLRLQGCKIATDAKWEELAHAILEQGNIAHLCLAETCLGYASQRSVQLVADVIVKAEYLEELDISGNFLFYEGFQHIASSIKAGGDLKGLKVLDISHNACSHVKKPRRLMRIAATSVDSNQLSDDLRQDADGFMCEDLPEFSPVALLCEALVDNRSLVELRLSNSAVDYTSDCALLTSLLYNKTLKRLDLSSNPHGDAGLRAIFRLLMLTDTVDYVDCNNFLDASLGPGVVSTDLGTPKGTFQLELGHPQHRALLRWLLYRAERWGLPSPLAAFSISSWSKKGIDWQSKKDNGNGWQVPAAGRLKFVYDLPLELEKLHNSTDAVQKWQAARRMPIPLKRFVLLYAMYEQLDASKQKLGFLRAMAETLIVKNFQLMNLIKAHPTDCVETARNLYGNVHDTDPMLFFELVHYPTMGKAFRLEARQRFNFTPGNPTNRYVLQLHSPLDRAVAEQLHVLNSFEQIRSKTLMGADVSQHHNYEGARNVIWETRKVRNFFNLELEGHPSGQLKLDYACPPHCAPSKTSQKSTDIFLGDILDAIEISNACESDKVMVLRTISQHLTVTPEQVRQFCKMFANPFVAKKSAKLLWKKVRRVMKQPALADIATGTLKVQGSAFSQDFKNPRAEVFVCLFNRCRDWPALCTHECLNDAGLFSIDCAKRIRSRLGVLRTLDAMNCCRPWRLCTTVSAELASKSQVSWDELASPVGKTRSTRWGFSISGEASIKFMEDASAVSTQDTFTRTKSENFTSEKGAAKAHKFAQLQNLKNAIKDGADKEKASFDLEPGRRYEFNLAVPEEWSCLFFLCSLNTKEEGDGLARCNWSERQNLMDQGYDFLPPPEWGVEGPAKKGRFECTYLSEHDVYVNVKARKSLAERFCGWEPSEE